MAGSAPRMPGLSRTRMPVVVRLVVSAVGLVQLRQPGLGVVDGRVGGQVEHHRLDLGAQEVVRAAGPQRREARMLTR